MERNKVIEYIQTPLRVIPTQDKFNHLMTYCMANGKNAGISAQFLNLAISIGLVDALFLHILEEYKRKYHIHIWHKEGVIIKVL